MEILVTGAPGWLGSRLVETLTRGVDGKKPPFPNAHVRCLVAPGVDPAPVANLGAVAVHGDVTKPETLREAVEGVDTVFHLAGIIHPKLRTSQLFAINTKGTTNVLDAAADAGARRFVFVSSNSVGGVNRDRSRLMREDDPPRPYLEYGRSKAKAEEAVAAANKAGRIETVILRPCWFYGPGQPFRQTRLFRMVKGGRPLIFGDGKNVRSMSYLDNTVQGLVLAVKVREAAGQTYWIADQRPYSTLEIYETIARLLGVDTLKPRFLPNIVPNSFYLADRMLQAVGLYQMEAHVAGEMNKDIACSIEKARTELGYAPAIGLEEGMRRSIEWCRAKGMDI